MNQKCQKCYVCEKETSGGKFGKQKNVIWLNSWTLTNYFQRKIDGKNTPSSPFKYAFHIECLRDMMGDEMFFEFFDIKNG